MLNEHAAAVRGKNPTVQRDDMIKKTLKTGLLLLCAGLLALAVSSCGELDDDTGTIELTADTTAIPADGVSSAAITATLKDESGTAVIQGTEVKFTVDPDLGRFSNGWTHYTVDTADDTGVVTVALVAGTEPGVAQVVATSNGVKQAISILLPLPGEITVLVDPDTLPADGVSTSTITVLVIDSDGVPYPDYSPVNFAITSGTGQFSNGGTTYVGYTAGGVAEAVYTASSTPGDVTIEASWPEGSVTISGTTTLTLE